MSDLKFDTVERALDWLESQEPAEILEVLEDYPGVRQNSFACPLAKFVAGTTGIEVSVNSWWVEDLPCNTNYRLKEKLLSFRKKFDDEDYPHLVKA